MREWLYGRNPVRECLRAGRRAQRKLVLAEGVRSNALVEEVITLARERACSVETRPRDELSHLIGSDEHQGIILEVGPYPYVDLEEIAQAAQSRGDSALVLLLDRLQDPQNAGTLLRTAEAMGVQGVILPKRRAVAITPAVAKTSAGASEYLWIARETNLVRTIDSLKEAGLWVYGLEDDPRAVLYTEIDWDRPLGIVVGSEGSGLRRLIREHCDGLARLPMRGQIESLNAAVAGSIVLYEVWHGRQQAAEGVD